MDISVTQLRASCLELIRRVEARGVGRARGGARAVSVTVCLFAAPVAATLLLACSDGPPIEDAGAPTSAASITAVQVAPVTARTAAASAAATTTATTSEVPASSASTMVTATATLAADPEYTIDQLRKCCTALAVPEDDGLVLPPRAAVIQGCKGYVELARRGEKTALQGLKELHRLHTGWPQECNLPHGVPAR